MAFSFGGAPAPRPAPTEGGGTATAPPALNFSASTFATSGTSAVNTPAPAAAAFGPTPAPAATQQDPSSSFSFAGSGRPTPVPASAASATMTTLATAGPDPSLIRVPQFKDVFPNLEIWSTLKRLHSKLSSATDEARWAGQELVHFLQCNQPASVGLTLANPRLLQWSPPDDALRQKLRSKPVVVLPGEKEAPLSESMFEDILRLATDLRVPESQAIALYAEANNSRTQAMLANEGASLVDTTLSYVDGKGQLKRPEGFTAVSKAARELYFFERCCALKSLLFLLQSRIQGQGVSLEATDSMIQNDLVEHLVVLTRDWTKRIFELEHELTSGQQQNGQSNTFLVGGGISTYHQQAQEPSKMSSFAKVHLVFAQQERQTAVECIFYLAYNTQLRGDEVGAIVELIRDLTNGVNNGADGLKVLNPFTDVPNPFEAQSLGSSPGWGAPFLSSFPGPNGSFAVKERNALDWQKSLVSRTWNSLAPHLLNCVAPLILSAVCAMDSRQELMDRYSHGPNSFGVGNKLLPPGESSSDGLIGLHDKLHPNAHEDWHRKDIWGLLAASYALLLRSAPSLVSSPRAGMPMPSIDARGASRACLELPAELKSFTFARLSLIPALQRLGNARSNLSELCDNSEFFLSVLSEFVAHYFEVLMASGDMPISRSRWEKDEKEELRLRVMQQQQLRSFQQWTGTNAAETEVIPSSVDLMKRPDCMDDVIALAVAMCSLGPDYGRFFWSNSDGEEDEPTPSRALMELERLQGMDDALLPCYLSFLSSLACSENGAAAVHEILSRIPDSSDGASGSTFVNWPAIMATIRWYAKELMPLDYDGVSSSKTSTNAMTGSGTNTSYYYFNESVSLPSSAMQSREVSSSDSSLSKPKELGDQHAVILSSHLALIMNVASKSAAARCAILSIKLPIVTGGSLDGGDETLLVLFALAQAPLSPELRGATLTTISCLLQVANATPEQDKQIRNVALTGWDCLESCQFLPISMLEQYPHDVMSSSGQRRLSMGFPPSSTTLAAGGESNAVLPADPSYGLVYEMEHIESRMGWYPSTEGFLKLLTALVVAAGCPKTLGQTWRIRPGCSPYIEFVVDFVLPRALGNPNLATMPILPFRIRGDQSRLVSHAFSVVDAVLAQYSVPSQVLKTKPGPVPSALLGVHTIVETVQLPSKDEGEVFVDDFRNLSVSQQWHQQAELSGDSSTGPSLLQPSRDGTTTTGASVPAIPSPKSPGFVILADVLSSAGGSMYHALAKTLVSGDGEVSLGFGVEADEAALCYALFGDTPPTFSSAKSGARQQSSKSLASLLKPIFPEMRLSMVDATSFDDGVFWRERSIKLALRILCAVAAREEAFHSAVVSAKEPLTIVPVLRIQRKRLGPPSLQVDDVQLSRLSSLLFSTELASQLRSSIVNYVGYVAANVKHDSEIATAALALFFFSYHSRPPQQTVRALCGIGADSETTIARALATRLRASSKRPHSTPDSQVLDFVLNSILSELRTCGIAQDSLVQVLLGLPSTSNGGNWHHGTLHDTSKPSNCFDAILELVSDEEYITGSATSHSASLCFEIIFRLYDLIKSGEQSALRSVLYTAERLRAVDFWRSSILMLLSERRVYGESPFHGATSGQARGDANILHTIAWLLKGVSLELRLLSGFASGTSLDQGVLSFLSPHPVQCETLLSLFFGSPDCLIKTIVSRLPLEKSEPTSVSPSKEALQTAMFELIGANEVVEGYVQVNGKKLLENMKLLVGVDDERLIAKWAENWNTSVAWECASSHLSNSLHILLGSSLSSLECVQSYDIRLDSSELGRSDPNRVSALRPDGLTDILTHLLDRLLCEGDPLTTRGMDDALFPSATLNLSSAILLVCKHLVDVDGTSSSGIDGASVCSLLAGVLSFSGQGGGSSYERTVVLGSALAIMLEWVSRSEPDFASQHFESVLSAARTLSILSCFRADEENDAVAILARSSLCALIETCGEDEAIASEGTLVYRILEPVLHKLCTLVAMLDPDVSPLLQTIAIQPFGAEILQNAGIFDALVAASERYLAEEARVKTTLKGASFRYQKHMLSSPPFLSGHLKLMSTMMASARTNARRSDVSKSVLSTLGRYKDFVEGLCNNFPADGDLLRLFMTCLVQAECMSEQPVLKQDHTNSRALSPDVVFLDSGILMLCSHLWENPLPKDLLPALPASLTLTPSAVKSQMVNVNREEENCWWDAANLSDIQCSFHPPTIETYSSGWGNSLSQKKWSDQKFEYSIVAADIVILGVALIRRTASFDKIDVPSIARGLCRCADAAWSVESRLSLVRSYGDINAMDMDDGKYRELEEEYLNLLGTKLTRCVEEMLLICLMYAHRLKNNRLGHVTSVENFRKVISSSLEHTGVETQGLTFGMQSDFAIQICKELRKELA